MCTCCFVLLVVWICLKCELTPDLLAWIYLTFGLRWGSAAWVCLAQDLKKATVVIESTLLLCMIPFNCNLCTVCFDRNCFAVYVLLSNCVWSNRLFLDLNRRDVLREPSRFPLLHSIISTAHCKSLWFIFYEVSFHASNNILFGLWLCPFVVLVVMWFVQFLFLLLTCMHPSSQPYFHACRCSFLWVWVSPAWTSLLHAGPPVDVFVDC